MDLSYSVVNLVLSDYPKGGDEILTNLPCS